MARRIRAFVVPPDEPPHIRVVEDTLGSWQQLVGGLIELIMVRAIPGAVCIINEEGIIKNLAPNLWINGVTMLYGPAVFVRETSNEDGDWGFADLEPEDISKLMAAVEVGQV